MNAKIWMHYSSLIIICSEVRLHEGHDISLKGRFELKLKKHDCLQKFSLTTSHYFDHIRSYTYWIDAI